MWPFRKSQDASDAHDVAEDKELGQAARSRKMAHAEVLQIAEKFGIDYLSAERDAEHRKLINGLIGPHD